MRTFGLFWAEVEEDNGETIKVARTSLEPLQLFETEKDADLSAEVAGTEFLAESKQALISVFVYNKDDIEENDTEVIQFPKLEEKHDGEV